MKSMKKSLNVTKVIGSFKKRTNEASPSQPPASANAAAATPAPGQSPETSAHNSVKAFCESGGSVQGDEILFLPPIVDAAESSPHAAAECARVIRKYLGKEYNASPSWQYNALMLVRILVDNPGETFTRNLDAEFVETCRKLLKNGRHARVRTMLMEMLEDFEYTKMYDENLKMLIRLWKFEKAEALKKNGGQPPPLPQRALNGPAFNPHSQNYFARAHPNTKSLPDPVELTSRLEEARTSAKLLEQVVMNTPPGEMLGNELIKEFADRCKSASRSIQEYMVSDNPAPDNDTMESLIDTNEQLQTALNQHQRAVLNAKKQLGLNEGGQPEPVMSPPTNSHDRILEWQRSQADFLASGEQLDAPDQPVQAPGNGKGKETASYDQAGGSGAGPSGSGIKRDEDDEPLEDPFKDPQPEEAQRHHYEPFNPGFNTTGGLGAGKATASGAGRARGDVSDDDSASGNKEPVYRY